MSRANLADAFLTRHVREGRGDRVAIRTEAGDHTYADLDRLASRFAHVLEGLGVRPEERVVLALPDGVEFAAAIFGIAKLGAVVVMLNPFLRDEEIEVMLDYTRARAIVVGGEHALAWCGVASRLARPPARLVVGGEHPGAASFAALARAASPTYATFPTDESDPAIWLFSGGTTGRPKAVVQPHASFLNTTERYGRGVLGVSERDVTIAVPRLYFGYATGSNLFFPLAAGGSAVLFPERPTPERLLELMRRFRPTIFITVPTAIQALLAHPGLAPGDLSCLRLATSAGEALPVSLHEAWDARVGVELLDGLGTAEMWHVFVTNRPGDVVRGTLGKVVPGYHLELVDDDGRSVPDGEVGRMVVTGGSIGKEYWQDRERSLAAFVGRSYRSGDLLSRDAAGNYRYAGRADELLKIHGKWVAPADVESALLTHAAVAECAVVGRPGEGGLVELVAYLVLRESVDDGELRAHLRTRLEAHKCPGRFERRPELPRTHLGKVDRGRLIRGG